MKRTATAVMLTATILMGGGLVTSQPAEASASTAVQQKTTYSTTANLNLRAGTSTKHKVLVTIPKGKTVTYISTHGSWLKVKYGSKTGYVSSKYVKASSTVSPTVATKAYTTTSNLSLKSGTSAGSKVLLTIPKNKEVGFISKKGSWAQVKYGNTTGWVNAKHIRSGKPTTAVPKPPTTSKPTTAVPKPPTTSKPTTPVTPKPPTGGQTVLGAYYAIDSLNMRTGGGIQYGIVTTIPKGGKVEHVATNGNWYQVRYGTKTGWVNASYLSKSPLVANEPDAGVKWLASEGVKRTNTLVSQMNRAGLKEPFLMPVQGRLTSPYGIRSNPTAAGFEFHTGVDYANAIGTPILATADAMVDRVVNGTTGYGKYIILRHDMKGMTFYSLYAHLHKIEVTPGEKVKRGEQIGQLGSTGRSTGPHLHFEIQNGSRQNVNVQTMLAY